MLIAGMPTRSRKLAAEDLHVAGQHEQLGVAVEQLEHRRLGALLAALLAPGRGGREHPPRLSRPRGRGGWRSPRRSRASSSPRRQRHSMSCRQWSWRETRMAIRRRSPHQRISQSMPKRSATCRVEALLEALALDGLLQEELGAQEEPAAAGVRGVLVGGDDVRSPLEQEARHAGHDPGRSGQPISRRARVPREPPARRGARRRAVGESARLPPPRADLAGYFVLVVDDLPAGPASS